MILRLLVVAVGLLVMVLLALLFGVEPVLKWFYFLGFGGAIIALAVAGFRLGRLLTEDINKD